MHALVTLAVLISVPVISLCCWDRFIWWYQYTYRPDWDNRRNGPFDTLRGCGGNVVLWLAIFLAVLIVALMR
jgi:hypothetical protein